METKIIYIFSYVILKLEELCKYTVIFFFVYNISSKHLHFLSQLEEREEHIALAYVKVCNTINQQQQNTLL